MGAKENAAEAAYTSRVRANFPALLHIPCQKKEKGPKMTPLLFRARGVLAVCAFFWRAGV
jgi:hypothetical protein